MTPTTTLENELAKLKAMLFQKDGEIKKRDQIIYDQNIELLRLQQVIHDKEMEIIGLQHLTLLVKNDHHTYCTYFEQIFDLNPTFQDYESCSEYLLRARYLFSKGLRACGSYIKKVDDYRNSLKAY